MTDRMYVIKTDVTVQCLEPSILTERPQVNYAHSYSETKVSAHPLPALDVLCKEANKIVGAALMAREAKGE